MNPLRCLPPFLLGAALLLAGPYAIGAEPGALDGQRFEGVFLVRGKTSGDADTLSFKGGRFRSSACDRHGYSDAPYQSRVQGDAVVFEAETESTKNGRLVWKGVVRNGKLDATATMVRPGKPPLENWVVAASPS